ncbi:3'-5' exonuclease family protein [Halosimplex salinum]|uniref:hypothetical protein n=1 Tax=Halosimplex salinum TaxID=1710538 RepID=UPI000F4A20A8|nr:hypothetical protein [Halosimplex salinum]
MVLEQVAFDIETTGFDAVDVVTTVGFAVPMGVRVFLQTDGRDTPGVESRVDSAVSETLVNVSTHASERELLVAVSEFVAERIRDDMLLVAYNGERWNGGFDVPFLRTRYAQRDLAWPFVDVPYADVMPLVTDRFNTTVDGAEQGGLVTAYDVLCGGSYGDLDPFDDSAEAVAAFEDGRFAELMLHNVADVLRTRALGRVAERYCSKSEFKVKSLTPTRSI